MTLCANCGKEIATGERRFLKKASGEQLPICCIQCGQDMADPGETIYILGKEGIDKEDMEEWESRRKK